MVVDERTAAAQQAYSLFRTGGSNTHSNNNNNNCNNREILVTSPMPDIPNELSRIRVTSHQDTTTEDDEAAAAVFVQSEYGFTRESV